MLTPNSTPREILNQINDLQRQVAELSNEVSDTGATVQTVTESASTSTEYGNQNYIRNGNFDLDRNRYLYDVDSGAGSVPADISEECAHWYAHPRIVTVETTGSMRAGSRVLVIDEALFTSDDLNTTVVIDSADGGNDLITTVADPVVSTTQVSLAASATTDVSNVRVRFRLPTFLEDSTDEDADSNQSTNSTVKTTAHSLYSTTVNNPDYDKTNGWARISSANYALTAPLPHNYISPNKNYFVSFVYKLASDVGGESEYPVQVYTGFFDATSGKQGYLEGTPLNLSATAEGTTGSTVREYMVVLYTAGGETIATEKVTVNDSNATLDASNYVSLTWDQPAGVVRSEIYRLTDGVYKKVGYPYPQRTFFDKGAVSVSADGWPAVDYTRPIAYVKSTLTNFAPARSDRWQTAQFNVPVPSTYAMPANAGKQWFVLGLQEDIVGASSDHALLIDLVSVDDKYGIFTRSPLDFLAKRQLSISPTGGDQDPNSGPIDPGNGCVVFDDDIETDKGWLPAIELIDNSHKYLVINRNDEAVKYKAEIIAPQTVYTVTTEDGGKLTGSGTHPVFTGEADVLGTRLKDLNVGDSILSKNGSSIVSMILRHSRPRHTIKISLTGEEKGFWHNNFGVHNAKSIS